MELGGTCGVVFSSISFAFQWKIFIFRYAQVRAIKLEAVHLLVYATLHQCLSAWSSQLYLSVTATQNKGTF